MTNQHPITPPPELVQQWVRTAPHPSNETEHYHYITLCAAQWASDQELEACCEWMRSQNLVSFNDRIASLRAARRPEPPSLKEQALTALHAVATGANDIREQHQDLDTIRKALEALPND